ncbi:unnamed protein product [Pelagomonas calceolata]|uniref:Nucleotide-diphospho-sugar transferase domain-containing protein n=1 Tax=Pelagomonas calceolata TaxID=35677 RepID=A0A8J2SS84_9STRA|nr:unnamed protein product [Pelagomonas calceolata]
MRRERSTAAPSKGSRTMAPRPPRHRPLKQRRAARHVLIVALGTCALAAWLLRSPRRVAVLMTATKRKVAAFSSEYGELKAAYVYTTSIDNKQRYCAVNRCELVVGADRKETSNRSARWTKVAWLREILPQYDWVVWTDVDCFFTRTDDVVDVFDAAYDVHFTLDSGSEERVNTGFFALRNTQWSRDFLEQVWTDNDGGEGLSDQRSFNTVLNGLSKDEHQRHVKLYSKSILNAFPSGTNYVATEDYEPPTPDGDETSETRVIHYAGQFGGARNSDGATPPTMLVQFLDLLLARHALYLTKVPDMKHERLRSVSDASKLISDARAALANCLKALKTYAPGASKTPVNFLEVYESTGEVCDADAALVNVRRPLSELVVAGEGYASSLLCSHGDDVPSTSISLSDAFPSPKVGVRKGHKQVHAMEGDLVVVAHECASLRGRHVVDGASSLILADSGDTDEKPVPAPRLAVLVASSGDDFWASVAPRALACLEACSTFQMGDETRRAPAPPLVVVGHEGGDWARIGVELFPANNVDATELYTCHGGGAQGAALVRERLGTPEYAAEGPVVVVEAALADEVRRLLPDARVKILTGAAPWEDMAGALGAARVLVVASGRAKRCDVVRCRETTSAMLRCRPRTLVLEVGGTSGDEALARELALGYRAVADVPAAVAAIHEAGVLAVDRFDFVGDV